MPSYKLTYFDGRGRAETCRLLLAAGGIEYEDNRLPQEQWPAFQPKTPFGQLPVMEVDGTVLGQTNSIARYVAKLAGLTGKTALDQAKVDMIMEGAVPLFQKAGDVVMGEGDEAKKAEKKKDFEENFAPKFFADMEKLAGDKGYFVSNQLTSADIAFYGNYESIKDFVTLPSFDKYPKLKKVVASVQANPGIAKWLKERPQTAW
ncbi:hematopoietic prostaglandin D synthase-like [Branchiostoma floridae]|uniref:glutathione transferase n=1 Tax=Branchiostoma floridae TaxID=7739 RepID=A0A9J7KRA0_BRAFL|nr:hematopoietic prostaglandin D synthase-like [Branchiostoma floridae]